MPIFPCTNLRSFSVQLPEMSMTLLFGPEIKPAATQLGMGDLIIHLSLSWGSGWGFAVRTEGRG